MSKVLYSFRRCPYAMRARMALYLANISYEHREIELKNKPKSMLNFSPKGTVPIFVLGNNKILDESLDIVEYALGNIRDKFLLKLIKVNDSDFKYNLDRYKYPERYPNDINTNQFYRDNCLTFLSEIETFISKLNEKNIILDVTISPFIRQFSKVDKEYFDSLPYENLKNWLDKVLSSEMFESIMKKHKVWQGA